MFFLGKENVKAEQVNQQKESDYSKLTNRNKSVFNSYSVRRFLQTWSG